MGRVVPILAILVGCAPPVVPTLDWVVTGRAQPFQLGFDVTVDRPANLSLSCVSFEDPSERHRLAAWAENSHRFSLFGLLEDHPYNCTITSVGTTTQTWRGTVTTSAGRPIETSVETLAGQQRWGSYTLVSYWYSGDNKRVALILDPEGRPRWTLPFDDATTGGIEVHYNDGLLLAGGGKGQAPMLVDLAGVPVYESGPPFTGGERDSFHHDVQLTEDGQVIKLASAENFTPGGQELPGGFAVEAASVLTDETSWSWNSQSGIDSGVLIPDPTGDAFHANAIQWTRDPEGDALYVSLRATNQIIRIDRVSGEISGILGRGGDFALQDTEGILLDDAEWFGGQHAPELEGNRLLVYDNGAHKGPVSDAFTRIAEYEIDFDRREAMLVWTYEEPGWFEPLFGDVDRLPNGNIVVASGHCNNCNGSTDEDARSFVAEVDPATGDNIWRMSFADHRDAIYRAQFIDGCDIFVNEKYCPR